MRGYTNVVAALLGGLLVVAPAAAQVTVTPYQTGSMQIGANSAPVIGDRGLVEGRTGAVDYLNLVQTDTGPILFESGLAIGGPSVSSVLTSGVDVTITNNTGSAFVPKLNSSIIPAGMGIYMAGVTDACQGARGVRCAPSTLAESLGGVMPASMITTPFAVSNIAFEVLSEGQVLYSVSASMSFSAIFEDSFSGSLAGAAEPSLPDHVVYTGDFADAAAKLTGFEIVSDPDVPGHFGFRWDATAFSVTGLSIDPGQSRTFQYRAKVSALSLVSDLDFFPVVLYAGFGDPIGRPGAGCCASPSFSQIGFNAPNLTLDGDGNAVIDFRIQSAAVPEPQTWALLIGGFGLVGGALRRRTRARLA